MRRRRRGGDDDKAGFAEANKKRKLPACFFFFSFDAFEQIARIRFRRESGILLSFRELQQENVQVILKGQQLVAVKLRRRRLKHDNARAQAPPTRQACTVNGLYGRILLFTVSLADFS